MVHEVVDHENLTPNPFPSGKGNRIAERNLFPNEMWNRIAESNPFPRRIRNRIEGFEEALRLILPVVVLMLLGHHR
jgi:hypothetical protein